MYTKLTGLAAMLLISMVVYGQNPQSSYNRYAKRVNNFENYYDDAEDSYRNSSPSDEDATLLTISRSDSQTPLKFKFGKAHGGALTIDLSRMESNQVDLVWENGITFELNYGEENQRRRRTYEAPSTAPSTPTPPATPERDFYQSDEEPEIYEERNFDNYSIPDTYPKAYTSYTQKPKSVPAKMVSTRTRTVAKRKIKQKIYSVQVGAFSSNKNAKRHIRNLIDQGINNAFVKEEVDYYGNPMYKVMIGTFVAEDDARSYSGKIKQYFGVSGFVKTWRS